MYNKSQICLIHHPSKKPSQNVHYSFTKGSFVFPDRFVFNYQQSKFIKSLNCTTHIYTRYYVCITKDKHFIIDHLKHSECFTKKKSIIHSVKQVIHFPMELSSKTLIQFVSTYTTNSSQFLSINGKLLIKKKCFCQFILILLIYQKILT